VDTITHGIAGALVGKAFFARACPAKSAAGDASPEALRQASRVAVFAATLGSVFPDCDIIFGRLFASGPMRTLEFHRGVTHSFVCLPVFAFLLALGTRAVTRRRKLAAPSLGWLTLIYAAGIALHIVLDLITSWGTMIWSPLSHARAAWDLTSIIDFVFTAVVLLPQVAAWAYRKPEGKLKRAAGAWLIFSLCAWGIQKLAAAVGYPFSAGAVVAASAVMAALFLLPAWRDWGLRVPRQTWCRAGVAALVIYLGMQAVAHQAAKREVEAFAASRGLAVEKLGALPMAPSLLYWNGLIRTQDGVYYTRLSLADPQPPHFQFYADAPANGYVEAARKLPMVQLFYWFARFPVVGYVQSGSQHTVEFGDLRFFSRRSRRNPFTLRVFLDDGGRILGYRWAND
jgi:membrane-bound metal-dependent hydrolase YbcI (DUF457 family)